MSSSSSSITTSTVNGVSRITGLASGIDVDGIVESLVAAEKEKKLNKLQQEVQTAEWKQEAYQSVISDLTDFADTYLSTTGSSSIMKASNYLKYDATSSDDAVTVSAASTASAGSHTVSVSQLATVATYSSGSSVSKEVQGSAAADYSSLSGESFVLTLDGTDYTIDLDNVTGLESLQTAIDDAVGSTTKVTVSTNASGYLEITAQTNSGVQAITISATDEDSDGTADNAGLSELFGTAPILSNRLSTSDTLAEISDQLNTALTFNSDGECQITINGTTITLDEDDTLAEVINAVADADVGATLSYNSLTGELKLTADDTGSGSTLTVSDSTSSNFISTLLGDKTAGKDAIITIDGETLTRSSNSVTVDGVTYTATAVTGTATTTTSATIVSSNNSAGFDTITTGASATDGTYTVSVAVSGGTYTYTLTDSSGNTQSTATSTDGTSAVNFLDSSGATIVTLGAVTTAPTDGTSTTFKVGSTVTLTDDDPATVTITQDSEGVYELVSNFVDAYNELIASINDLIDENADSDYPPLTDDQKDEMDDDEITAWETKAKVGLLESDSTLESLLSDLRTALYDSISGSSISLSDIGITTSSDYTDQGMLEIDEDTLTSAISSDPEAIMNLFTQKATSTATTSSVSGKSLGNNSILYSINSTDLQTRYEEEGIAYRFFDILEQNVSTTTFSSGNEGLLLEIAGIDGDNSETDNTLTTLIEKYEDEISDEEDRIDDYEERMYDKYTTLETYISTMNSQLSAITSLTSSS